MENRGGKREGAGRKPKAGVVRKVSVRLTSDQWQQIDEQAQNSNISSVVSSLVSQALQQKGDGEK